MSVFCTAEKFHREVSERVSRTERELRQCESYRVKFRTLPTEKRLGLVRQILSNLDQISDKQPEHHSLEGAIAMEFIWIAGMGTPEFSGFMARAMKLHKLGIAMNPAALGNILT